MTIEGNKKLIEEYPFLLPRNRFTGEVMEDYDYSWTELDGVETPVGWDLLLLMLVEEIKQCLDKADYADKYRIMQVKEKFGSLRWYDNGAPKEIYDELQDIIGKYGVISEHVCHKCGKPDSPLSNGYWIYTLCEDCWNKNERNSDRDFSKKMDVENAATPLKMKYTQFSTEGNKTVEIDISDTVKKYKEFWRTKNGLS